MNKNYKPKEFAELLNVSVLTLQRWDNAGKLKAYRTPTNRRYYTYKQYQNYMGITNSNKKVVTEDKEQHIGSWFIYAVLSAVFASLTAILGKIGISGIDSNLGTAIRTTVVLVMAWLMVIIKRKTAEICTIGKKELLFIVLSGFATGASWLCYYKALQDGPASVVVPIDKLSILVTIAFSWIVFKEKLTPKSVAGILLITLGTVLLALI